MTPIEKTLDVVLRGTSDKNVSFNDLRSLLLHLGLAERVRGSHHMFRREGVLELINIQCDGNKAKSYQIRQVRHVILKYRLGGPDHG